MSLMTRSDIEAVYVEEDVKHTDCFLIDKDDWRRVREQAMLALPRHSLAAQDSAWLAAEIANAKRFDRKVFGDDQEFGDWAQSRARHYLALPPTPARRECEHGNAYNECNRCNTSFQPTPASG